MTVPDPFTSDATVSDATVSDAAGLLLDDLTAGYPRRRGHPERRVLEGLNAAARPGELTVLAGPNGTGKSTLLRTLARLQPALAGRVRLDGADLRSIDQVDLARRLAVVLTEREVPPLLTARELAALGRHPHTGFAGRLTGHDAELVDRALAAVRAGHLAGRPVTELSDGERQRVLTARALAQDPAAILLDEPTAFLDVPSRVALMGLLHRLARERSLTVLVSTHDLELALRIADRIWLITPDGTLRTGTPEELTLDGSIAASFNTEDLSFAAAEGVFVLHTASAGTARIDGAGPHRPLLERALARQGWAPTTSGSADLAATWDGVEYEIAFDGERHRTASIADITDRARRAAGHPPKLRPVPPARAGDALAAAARLGAYFATESAPSGDGWRPLTDLIGDPAVIDEQITAVAARLGTAERRVAASILHLGIAARLWSPAVGALVTGGIAIELEPARVRWRPAESGPLRLHVPAPTGWECAGQEQAVRFVHDTVMTSLLEPLAAVFGDTGRLAPGLLRGNAASALAGTVRAIARAHPEHTVSAIALGRRLLAHGPLRDTGELAEPAPGHPFFVRRSCCLYYRIPDGGKCGDCALLDSATRQTQWDKAIEGAS